MKVAAARRWSFALKDPQPMTGREIGAMAARMGMSPGTIYTSVNRGMQIGEPFMAGWAAAHPTKRWEELFVLVPPSDDRPALKTRGDLQEDRRTWKSFPEVPLSFQDAIDQDAPTFPHPDGATVAVLYVPAPGRLPATGKVPEVPKGVAVAILGLRSDGGVQLYPATRFSWAQDLLEPLFTDKGINSERINWREGSEPDPEKGQIARPRHYKSDSLG